ncbi:sensor histidine kinase [Jiangella asiatica]|uniref:histidine kinase n=1 Tax=Jiangella asiatica TaxID=2530372 RepID=A0A4R5DCL9_9ACTN|nr:HAMP domain-containing sensor histidine kinase [Jiangella asiatica]TDE11502.1 HAMP domain-containing histidine kinase [Jiangella asiatica]
MRTTLGALLVVGLALALGAVALVLVMRATLLQQAEDAVQARADDLAAAMAAGRAPALGDGFDDDSFVQVVDGSGVVADATGNVTGAEAVDVEPGRTARVELPAGDEMIAAAASAGDQVVVVGQSVEDVGEATAVVIRLLAAGLPVALAVVGFTTWRAAGRALAPVEAIRSEVDAISGSQLHRRVPEGTGHDEISRLARTMNRMLGRLEQARSRQRKFVSDASHELRSPVASIRQHAEVALAHPGRTTVPELAGTVLAEDLRVQHLVEDLLLLARADERRLRLAARSVDVDDLVLDESRRLRRDTGLAVDTTGVSAGRVNGDAAALRRVLRNLGDNAVRHASAAISLSVSEHDGGVVVTVDDDGPGIPAADRERVLRRFVRLDEARDRDVGGVGLGLAIVDELVAAHGGAVEVGDAPSGGARVVVWLPAGR